MFVGANSVTSSANLNALKFLQKIDCLQSRYLHCLLIKFNLQSLFANNSYYITFVTQFDSNFHLFECFKDNAINTLAISRNYVHPESLLNELRCIYFLYKHLVFPRDHSWDAADWIRFIGKVTLTSAIL